MRACVHACVHVRVWVSCSNQQLLGEEEEEREGVGIKSRKRGRGEMRGREREERGGECWEWQKFTPPSVRLMTTLPEFLEMENDSGKPRISSKTS